MPLKRPCSVSWVSTFLGLWADGVGVWGLGFLKNRKVPGARRLLGSGMAEASPLCEPVV